MKTLKQYILCYDIIGDKGRRRIEKIISHYGVRIQYSVFECKISSVEYKALLNKLKNEFEKPYFAPLKDSILIFTLCEQCGGKTKAIGKAPIDQSKFFIL